MSVLALAFALVASPVFAQGGTSTGTISGVVTDNENAVVPGATIVLKNKATGETLDPIVTNDRGQYSFPGLTPGTYTLTVTMPSFKTAELEVRLQSGGNQTGNVKLELGKREEVVNVTSGSDIARLDRPDVSTTINADFIQTLPRADRNALSFLPYLPGVTTVGAAAGARFNTTISGLPRNTFNITIDGVSNSNLLQSNDGFFSLVVPRLDAVEEVTLTTASAGADATGQGAVQIRFVTRSGTNKFETSLYWFIQHRVLNSNTFFNRLSGLDRPAATNYTYGGRIGGPIVLPGFDGRGRAFFFFNQEESYNPIETARSRTILSQSALAGNYCWSNGASCVNLLTLAAANGQVSTYDPQVKSLLDAIDAATMTTGTIEQLVTSPNTATYRWLVPNKGTRHSPTTNITVNLNPKNRLQGSYYWQRFNNSPDTLNSADQRFPGFPAFGDQSSYRTTASMSLRSTISAQIVNEIRGGWQWSPVGFFVNANPGMFDNQGGYALGLGFVDNAHPNNANSPSERNTANWTVSDQFNWLKGAHSFQFGGDFTRIDDWAINYNNVPSVNFGLSQTLDPASAMFSTGNFPGATSGERNSARLLYAMLTGRVTSIGATGRLNEAGTEYVYNGPTLRREYQDDYSFYAQDTWRWKPTVTFTLGVRYQYTLPMTPKNGVFTTISTRDACGPAGFRDTTGGDGLTRFCNMFGPRGEMLDPAANAPTYVQYSAKTKGYNTDFNNVGPNLGMAWRPNVQNGIGRTILGDPEIATFNGGYSRSFNRERLDQFLNIYSGNPGQTIPATRSTSVTAFPLLDPGESYPKLYRAGTLGAPILPGLSFPLAADFGDGAWVFDPDIQVPYTDSWNVSFQRGIGKDMVGEIRYVGNTNRYSWSLENWNQVNIFDTGWSSMRDGVGTAAVGEYQMAMANLRANVLAGHPERGFAYTGTDGTVPLPITLAHLMGPSRDPNNPAHYFVGGGGSGSRGLFTFDTFVGALDPFNANPRGFASNLYLATTSSTQVPAGASTRLFDNAMLAGYPENFWVLNPLLDSVNVNVNSSNKPLNHQMILQLRRRLANGLAAQVSYTYSTGSSGRLSDFHLARFQIRSDGVPHAIQALFTYDVPVGRGKRFGANMNPILDGVVGGWTFSGTARAQRQSFRVENAVLVGMTRDEAQAALQDLRFQTDPVTGAITVWNIPEDIYTNTRLAYATNEREPTFYGVDSTGVSLAPTGPNAIPTASGSYRYFAPAGGPDCAIVFYGDCGAQDLWFTGRFFGEMDVRLAKQFQLPGRARFELSAEVFNALMAKNFAYNNFGPGTSSNIFRSTSTQNGARTAQIVVRVSW
jgi:hypothetical protein